MAKLARKSNLALIGDAGTEALIDITRESAKGAVHGFRAGGSLFRAGDNLASFLANGAGNMLENQKLEHDLDKLRRILQHAQTVDEILTEASNLAIVKEAYGGAKLTHQQITHPNFQEKLLAGFAV